MLLGLFLNYLEMKKYLISGLVDTYRIKLNLFAISPNSAISVFKQKYPTAEDVYVIQDLFKNQKDLQC